MYFWISAFDHRAIVLDKMHIVHCYRSPNYLLCFKMLASLHTIANVTVTTFSGETSSCFLIASVCTVHRSPVRQQQTHWQCSKKKSKQLSISILCCKSGRSSCLLLHGTCRTLWAKPNWGPSGAAVLSYLFSKICGTDVHIFPYSSLNGYLFQMLVL